MTLKPSMREKWRYISFRIEAEAEVSERDAREGIARSVIRFIGELGASKARPKVIEYDGKRREGIMRCLTEGVGEVRAALALINDLGASKCAVRTLKTSGTLRALREKTKDFKA